MSRMKNDGIFFAMRTWTLCIALFYPRIDLLRSSLHLRAYLAALPTNPPECSHTPLSHALHRTARSMALDGTSERRGCPSGQGSVCLGVADEGSSGSVSHLALLWRLFSSKCVHKASESHAVDVPMTWRKPSTALSIISEGIPLPKACSRLDVTLGGRVTKVVDLQFAQPSGKRRFSVAQV